VNFWLPIPTGAAAYISLKVPRGGGLRAIRRALTEMIPRRPGSEPPPGTDAQQPPEADTQHPPRTYADQRGEPTRQATAARQRPEPPGSRPDDGPFLPQDRQDRS
jgi:hypothetical protein